MTPEHPSWATMPKGTPSSASSAPSEDPSPVSFGKTRKRKISTQASQSGKRPRLGQSATQPVPKRSAKGKTKQRNGSEGPHNRDWSPGQEVDAVQATQSARAQASTSASTSQVPTRRKGTFRKETARKSTGTMKAPLFSSARMGKRPSLSQARRYSTPQVNGDTLDISDEEPRIAPPIRTLTRMSHPANFIDLTGDDDGGPVDNDGGLVEIISLLSSDEEDNTSAANPIAIGAVSSVGKLLTTLRSPVEPSASISGQTTHLSVSNNATLDERLTNPIDESMEVDLHQPFLPSSVTSRARSVSMPPPVSPVQDPSPFVSPPKPHASPHIPAVPSETTLRRSSLSDIMEQKGSIPTPSLSSATQPFSGTSTKQSTKLPIVPTLPDKPPFLPPLARRPTLVIAEPFLPPVPAPDAPDWGRRSSHSISRARIGGLQNPLKSSLEPSHSFPHPATSSSSNSKPPPSPEKEVDASNATRSLALAISSQATVASTSGIRPAKVSTNLSASPSPSKLISVNQAPVANADDIPRSSSESPSESPSSESLSSESPVGAVSRAVSMLDWPPATKHKRKRKTNPGDRLAHKQRRSGKRQHAAQQRKAEQHEAELREAEQRASVARLVLASLAPSQTSPNTATETNPVSSMVTALKSVSSSVPRLPQSPAIPKPLNQNERKSLADVINDMQRTQNPEVIDLTSDLTSDDSDSEWCDEQVGTDEFLSSLINVNSVSKGALVSSVDTANSAPPEQAIEQAIETSPKKLELIPPPPRTHLASLRNRMQQTLKSREPTSLPTQPISQSPSGAPVPDVPKYISTVQPVAPSSTSTPSLTVERNPDDFDAQLHKVPAPPRVGNRLSSQNTSSSIISAARGPSNQNISPMHRPKQSARKSTGGLAPRASLHAQNASTQGRPSVTQAGSASTPKAQAEDTVDSAPNEGGMSSHLVVSGDSNAVNSLTIEVDSLSMSGGCEDIPMVVNGDDFEHPMLISGPGSPTRAVSMINKDEANGERPKGRPPVFEEDDEDEEVFNLLYPDHGEAELDHPTSQSDASAQSLSRPASTPPLSDGTSSRSRRSLSARSVSGGPLPSTGDAADGSHSHVGDYQTPIDDYITFERVRGAVQQLPAEYLLAKDLPHTLQDQMNRLPPMYRKQQEAVGIFEAAIRESSAVDEPGAPAISIINPIEDDDEATPPWEFHYTNRLWYGEDVPAPDLKSLKSCDCHGVCNPKSKSCACVKRQSEWYDDDSRQPGFAYHNTKSMQWRLQQPEKQYPIFECNDFCGCDETCGNRVVQRGRKCEVNIVKTKQKGWGVFAGSKRIPAGTFVGIYAGELLRDSVSEERGQKYNVFGRTYLFDVDGYQIGKTLGVPEGEHDAAYTIDAYHAGNFTRFLNHSCEPNCMILCCYINEGDIERPLLTIFSMVDIEPNEELSFSYSGAPDDTEVEAAVKAVNGEVPSGKAAVYAKCCCGAPSCKGVMFK